MSRSYDIKTEMSSKRMKKSFVEETLVNITQPKKIVDIIIDCLESVFEFLDFVDLINVAEANKQLKVAAEIVFVRKLNKRMIVVNVNSGRFAKHRKYISIWDNAIHTSNSLLGFKIIRLFAQYISEIYLKITICNTLREKLFIHVNEYCHKTLNILHVYGDHLKSFGEVKHPFGNIEEFTYEHGLVGPGCGHFDRLFPRLRQLSLNDNDVLYSKFILQNFPSLRTFTLFCNPNRKPYYFTESDLKTIAALNPQIQDLTLKGNVKLRIWEYMNAKLKDLKSICLSYSQVEVDESFIGPRILFNNVEIFDVYCSMQRMPGKVKPIDVFSFKRLRKLKLKCYVEYGQMEMWLDFVLAHPTIEKLEICLGHSWPEPFETLENLSKKLNNVRRNVKFFSLRVNEITRIIGIVFQNIQQFLETHQWFDTFSVHFFSDFANESLVSEMKNFSEKIPKIKNYKMKKKSSIFITESMFGDDYGISIDFEKCKS